MNAPTEYLLHLADNALILGQRNAEWCGHGPILEEDIALSNNSLDLIGQARMLYQHAAALQGGGATEDTLAYFRDVPDFKNYTLCELPHTALMAATSVGDRDFATTIVRNFLYSSLMVLVWDQLQSSQDTQLAAIAAKSLKEVRYHLRHSRDWLVRLGDGTEESHARAQTALDSLWRYTGELFDHDAVDDEPGLGEQFGDQGAAAVFFHPAGPAIIDNHDQCAGRRAIPGRHCSALPSVT
jgi:ring-1,2-phenylacetyl-CoA epoxidase subunit PaaC